MIDIILANLIFWPIWMLISALPGYMMKKSMDRQWPDE